MTDPIRPRYGDQAEEALRLWVKLARTFATMSRLTDDHIRSVGLTQPQFGVLECLGHKGPLTLGELCRKQLVSGGNMTVVVDNLERDGLVERLRSEEDRRQVRVQLTTRGTDLFTRIFPPHAQLVEDLIGLLSVEEQKDLARLLRKLGLGLQERAAAKLRKG